MIVADTSSLLAILFGETDAPKFIQAIGTTEVALPASVVVEAHLALIHRSVSADLDKLISDMEPEIVPLDATIASLAVRAFRRYGKGRHKAGLNFGDCLVYATAKHLDLPLLYKGSDFLHTDLTPALQALQ